MIKNKLAIIETPNQCLFFKSLFNYDLKFFDIYFVKRKKFKNNFFLFKQYFPNLSVKIINVIKIFYIIVKDFNRYETIVIGSHLGLINKSIIIFSLILNSNVIILDDGFDSFKYAKWVCFISFFFKKLKWYSYYKRELNKNFLINYCLISCKRKNTYNNTYIIALSSHVLWSEKDEIKITEFIKNLADQNNAKTIILPHRFGRIDFYKKMKLKIIKNYLCFEEWYLDSNFNKGCKIFCTISSIMQVFEDKRVNITVIDHEQRDEFSINLPKVEDHEFNINQIIKVSEILNKKIFK
jgi:hypothetical protein